MSGPRTSQGAATILDVAEAAGVSVATVSRALRGLPNVAVTTREKVVAAAAELNYRADPNAARLAAGRSQSVGIAVPVLDSWFFSRVIAGAEDTLSEAGYDVLIFAAHSVQEGGRFVAEVGPMHQRLDGLILAELVVTPEESRGWQERGAQVVSVGPEITGFPSVGIDDYAGGRLAMEHLIGLGHRDIALIGGVAEPPFHFAVPTDRRRAYRDALLAAGLPARPEYDAAEEFSVAGGERAMQRLIADAKPLPSAVFAMSDEMAMGAMRAARERGIRIPEQLSLVGFDDHEMADVVELTTIRQPVPARGARAAELMLAALGGSPAPSGPELLPLELVVRGTTRPLA